MSSFCNHINNLITKVVDDPSNELYFQKGTIHEAIANARLNGLYADMQSVSVFLNTDRLEDNRLYYRITVQLVTQNNAKVKNIESVMDYIRLFETHFIFIDKIKLYQLDGIICIDIYRSIDDLRLLTS